jgi:NADH-quinone oxidoreductase subunit K
MPSIPLWWYLIVAAGLFAVGLFGALTRRNAISVLMGVELMLNAVNVQVVAFWRYITPTHALTVDGVTAPFLTGVGGQAFAVFVIALAGAEAAVGLALIIAIYRLRRSVELDDFALMRG